MRKISYSGQEHRPPRPITSARTLRTRMPTIDRLLAVLAPLPKRRATLILEAARDRLRQQIEEQEQRWREKANAHL